jgi:2-polyprenyl-6-methoxyphenol hydroxylase-like FAD-dependent oxidoreductase
MSKHAPVLIVGAGPTGLVLALLLTRLGVSVRIVDKTEGPGTTSRALAVQARTLEFYRQLELADTVVEHGRVLEAANLWVKGNRVAHLPFGEIGKGESPFPFLLIYPQDEHEKLLIDRLQALGVTVERGTELLGFEDLGDHVVARLKRRDGAEEICETKYIAGCDGAHSTVRQHLQTEFSGGTYARLFYVADVEANGPAMDGELHVALDDADFLALFPLKGAGRARFIGTVAPEQEQRGESLGWQDVNTGVLSRMHLDVTRVHWFSTYRVHHRVAGLFAKGRSFILGDAAHIHSPVGGQGMNTGIGDAMNLGWKLAEVLRNGAPASLLNTYESERIPFARSLVATTDRAFVVASSEGAVASFVRANVVPGVASMLFGTDAMRRFIFRTVSQTRINYHGSPLSQGAAGSVRGGDRLPWAELEGQARDNFVALATLDWQLHIYGTPAAPELLELCKSRGLPCHVFPWGPSVENAGFANGASYLIRPDGYVALADATSSPAHLENYLDAQLRGSSPAVHDAEG